jgi:hypothetical protein
VFPRQGHYARDAKFLAGCQPADIQLDHLRDLTNYALPELGAGSYALCRPQGLL